MLVLIILSVEIVPIIAKSIGPKAIKRNELILRLIVLGQTDLSEVIEKISKLDLKIRHVHIKDLPDGNVKVEIMVAVNESRKIADVYYDIRKIGAVLTVEAESLEN